MATGVSLVLSPVWKFLLACPPSRGRSYDESLTFGHRPPKLYSSGHRHKPTACLALDPMQFSPTIPSVIVTGIVWSQSEEPGRYSASTLYFDDIPSQFRRRPSGAVSQYGVASERAAFWSFFLDRERIHAARGKKRYDNRRTPQHRYTTSASKTRMLLICQPRPYLSETLTLRPSPIPVEDLSRSLVVPQR